MSFRTELQMLVASIATKKEVVSSQSGIIEEIAKDFGEISSLFNNAQLAWVQHQNDLSALEKEVSFFQNQVEELSEKTTNSDNEINSLKSEVSSNTSILEIRSKKNLVTLKLLSSLKGQL